MIYDLPPPEDELDQGDLIDACPVVRILDVPATPDAPPEFAFDLHRVVLLTQTCDIANKKVDVGNVASVFDAGKLVEQGLLKPADIKGPLRSGRIWGLYFLPANEALGLSEMIVDLRRLHTVRLEILRGLCRDGHRKARLLTPYREHLSKHFADSFSRIGLPQPYETL